MDATTTTEAGRSPAFARSKLASFLGFAPLTLWTVMHVWNNLAVFQGADAWRTSVTQYQHPISLLVTSIVVLLPLALHTAWGIGRLRTSRPNNARYGTFENLKYLLQRLSAVGVLLFLGAHIWLAFVHPRVTTGQPEPFADIASEMRHHAPTLIVYVLGTLGVAYHLGNGLSGFAWSWGLAGSRKSMKGFERAGVLLFVVLLAMSWAAIYGLWQAGGQLPPPAH
jgi:succinate dehydrogenase / fumarate reductase, cytochrome b subunit